MKNAISRSQDLRKGRVSELGRCYLITTCTYKRQKYFEDFCTARQLVQAIRYQDDSKRTETLAYVVMPDHFHWLFYLRASDLSKIVASVKWWISRRTEKTVWQRNYHDRALRKEESIISTSRYIVANPLRSGIVTAIGDYPHWDAVWLTG